MKQPRKVLIIDRNSEFRLELFESLSQSGYAVHESKGTARALRDLFQIHPEIILLELATDWAEGWNLLADIRAVTPTTPILLMGDGISQADRRRSRSLNVQAFWKKDASPNKLVSQIHSMLQSTPVEIKVAPRAAAPSQNIPLHFLTRFQILRIDAEIEKVGKRGEIHLIKRAGRLYAIENVLTG